MVPKKKMYLSLQETIVVVGLWISELLYSIPVFAALADEGLLAFPEQFQLAILL